jgi:putative FmdB family regulatory protein
MPTYVYACTACEERLEAVQRIADAPLTECPACGGSLRKVIQPVGIVFKGSGFYKTDSRKGTGNGAAKPAGEGKESTTPSEAPAAAPAGEKSGSGDGAAAAKPAPAGSGDKPASGGSPTKAGSGSTKVA